MFWIEFYLIFQMSLWFVAYLGLNFPVGERNALIVLLGLGIKCFLLFIFITLGLERFIVSPVVFSKFSAMNLILGPANTTKIRIRFIATVANKNRFT